VISLSERKKRALAKAKRIKLFLLDVDGVLTDGSLLYGADGSEFKVFNIHDGYGIQQMIQAGIRVGIISGAKSEIVRRRAAELGIVDVYEEFLDKLKPYEKLKSTYGYSDEEVGYMGDELFDIPLLRAVGFSAAPASARAEVKSVVDFVTRARGGDGAVREVIDFILHAQGKGYKGS